MTRDWPFVGREEQLARCGEILGDPRRHGVVLSGSPGVGKTRLLGECARLATATGFPVAQVTAHRSSAAIPLGALAPLLPAEDVAHPFERLASDASMLRRAADTLASSTTFCGDRPLVLAIDDAHLLDDASSLLVYQLTVARRIFPILTSSRDHPNPEAVTGLWRDDHAERLEIEPFDRATVAALLTAALGGSVAAAAVDELLHASAGNALVLRELCRGSLDAGLLAQHQGLWRISGPAAPSTRLRELVATQLAQLSSEDRVALEIVAVGEPLGLEVARGLGGVELESLERRGLVTATATGHRVELSVTSASMAEVLRAELPLLRKHSIHRGLATQIHGSGARRRGDVLFVATLLVDVDGTGPPELLVDAAQQAFFANDLVLAERLARAADHTASTFRTRHLLADVLYRLGRADELAGLRAEYTADDIADHIADDGTEAEQALQAMHEAAAAYWQHGLREEADAILATQIDRTRPSSRPSSWRDEMTAMRATLDVNAGDPALALERLSSLHRRDDRSFVVASLAATLALPHVGRAEEALELLEPARAVHRTIAEPLTMYQLTLLSSTEASSLMELGRLADAVDVSLAAYRSAEAEHDTAGQAFTAFTLGRASVMRGRVRHALAWSREAAVLFDAIGHRGPLRWALGGVALSAALAGDVEAAAQTLQRVDDAPPHPASALDTDIARARAWLHVATGDPATPRATLAAEADRCHNRGLIALEVLVLHELARLGDAAPGVERMPSLVAGTQGRWLAALAADAAAIATNRADALTASAESLAEFGADLLAAEAATRAAAAFARGGHQREAAAWRRRAFALLAGCEGASTPATVQGDGPVPLTVREREIALLAAAGLSSKVISERLILSTRTVDNNLARVFGKLGISDRSAIGAALGCA